MKRARDKEVQPRSSLPYRPPKGSYSPGTSPDPLSFRLRLGESRSATTKPTGRTQVLHICFWPGTLLSLLPPALPGGRRREQGADTDSAGKRLASDIRHRVDTAYYW